MSLTLRRLAISLSFVLIVGLTLGLGPAAAQDGTVIAILDMERILRGAQQDGPKAQRVLELNPTHPLVKNLAQLHADGKTEVAEPLARLLLDDALLLEGTVKDPAAIGRRLQALLQKASESALGV